MLSWALFLASDPPPDLTVPVEERGDRHLELMAELAARTSSPDVVFLGDSITEGWRQYPEIWTGCFGPNAANLGIKWDRVENVLWRVTAGELDRMSPRIIVILIGTNNLSRGDPPQAVATGIRRLIDEVRLRQPSAHVLLMAILPREREFSDRTRRAIRDTNELLGAGGSITFLQAGTPFVLLNGELDSVLMPDTVHPSRQGYEKLAEILALHVQRLRSR